jgi:ADP-heptose:LPS heptosyltransferase
MKIKTQLFIDRLAVFPIMFSLNYIVRIIGFMLRIDHRLNRKFNKIAVCKFKGMGSILQATPLLATLRKNFPYAEIIFISTEANRAILSKINLIDKAILIDDNNFLSLCKTFPGFILKIIKCRIGLYFDLEIYSSFSSLVTTLSLSKNRVGYYMRSSNYRMGIYTHMVFFNVRIPISQAYLQLSRLLSVDKFVTELFQLKVSNSDLSDVTKEKYFIINPNASDLRLERRWPKENFIILIKNLTIKFSSYKIYIIGSKSERDYVESIMASLGSHSNVINVAGKTSLDELISLIHHSELMITNDTGPMHLAFSLKTPTVSLFGPCLPNQYSVYEKTVSLYKNLYCSPCVHEFIMPPCKGNNSCMKLITVNEVEEAINTVLLKDYPNLEPGSDIIYFHLQNNEPLGIIER